jgi:hypothetical protein
MRHAQGGKSGPVFSVCFSMSWSASALLSPVLSGQLYGHFGGHSVWLGERDTGVVDLTADLPGDAPPTQAKALATSERTSSLS